MDFNSYQEKAHETANYPSGTIGKEAHAVDYIYPVFGLAEEAGEVVGLMKRRIRAYEKDRKKSTFLHFAEELGDVFWYLAACCQVENITLDDIWKVNREKLEARYGNTARVGGHATSNPPLVITQCDNVGGKSE